MSHIIVPIKFYVQSFFKWKLCIINVNLIIIIIIIIINPYHIQISV